MKNCVLLLAVFVAVLAVGSSAFATTVDPNNEVDNWCFVDGDAGWEATENVDFNAGSGDVFGRPHVAIDPWPIPGAAGSIRQIVDNARSPYWDPNLNHKIVNMEFDVYTTGDAYVVVGFDWWDYMGDEKPSGAGQYGEMLPMQFASPDSWTRFSVVFDWAGKPGQTQQPRWISVQFGFFGCSGTGHLAAVDDIVLTSRCVPEPSSLLAFSGSLLGLAGFALRRRH